MPGEVTVFDYGCGDGGDWPNIVHDHPRIKVVGFEPDKKRAAIARTRIPLVDAPKDVSADVIVSFSVFEHVRDRPAYLATAKRALKQNGVFFLNYDDGHFRVPYLKFLYARLRDYHRRVEREEADRLIAEAGFSVESCFYNNVQDLKTLYKVVPNEQREEYVRAWMAFEDAANEFRDRVSPTMGDDCNLWRVMNSRTLKLRHA